MKKVALIVSIVSIFICIMLLIVGLTNGPTESPSTQRPTETTNLPSYTTPTLPTETPPPPPYDQLTPGSYYLIAGTNVNHYLQENDIEYRLENNYLHLELHEDGNATFWYYGNHSTMYSEQNGKIEFDNPNLVLDIFPFEIEHDDKWIQNNQPTRVDELTYSFDKETQTITIQYGIESMELRYFPSTAEAAQWLMTYIPHGGGIHMPDYSHQYDEILSLIQ